MMKLHELLMRAQVLRTSATAKEANNLSLDLALAGIDAGAQAARMELERTDLLHGIRDRIMAERDMAATPAEKEARKDAQYIEYCEALGRMRDQSERATEWARYYARLAVMEVAHV